MTRSTNSLICISLANLNALISDYSGLPAGGHLSQQLPAPPSAGGGGSHQPAACRPDRQGRGAGHRGRRAAALGRRDRAVHQPVGQDTAHGALPAVLRAGSAASCANRRRPARWTALCAGAVNHRPSLFNVLPATPAPAARPPSPASCPPPTLGLPTDRRLSAYIPQRRASYFALPTGRRGSSFLEAECFLSPNRTTLGRRQHGLGAAQVVQQLPQDERVHGGRVLLAGLGAAAGVSSRWRGGAAAGGFAVEKVECLFEMLTDLRRFTSQGNVVTTFALKCEDYH
ncbi:unnamed protein product [Sphagnum tenellum]